MRLRGLLAIISSALTVRTWQSPSPVAVFFKILAIALVSLILTLFIPGLIAHRGGVFFPDSFRQRLSGRPAVEMQNFEQKVTSLKAQLDELDKHILRTDEKEDPDHRTKLLDLRIKLASYISEQSPPISLIPFYLNPQMLLWPGIYAALGVLILVCPPKDWSWNRHRVRHVLSLGTVIYVFYEWPLWVRNFALGNHGRVVYAYPNYDIDPASFWCQELTVFGFAALIAILWLQWSHQATSSSRELKEEEEGPTYSIFSARAASRLVEYYSKWTYCSVILALGFLFFTNFFWSLVAKYHDQRYLLSAVLAHSLWGVSWVALSLPTWQLWLDWGRRRSTEMERVLENRENQGESLSALRSVAIGLHPATAEELSKMIGEADPIKALNFGAANLTAAVSFVLPLIQFFIK